MAAYRYNDADDDHDDFRNSGDNGVNGAANGRENSTLRGVTVSRPNYSGTRMTTYHGDCSWC